MIERVKRLRKERDNSKVKEALQKLEEVTVNLRVPSRQLWKQLGPMLS